ncbi:hypothetical protein GCM10009720_16350 [Yaniella flava]|uniref:Uncharacterized protein n=2 Tax=Yaniella flava TaxID=287930 RepID=A0ABN2UFK3_9MICC
MWSDVDTVSTEDERTYGRAFVILHPKQIRIDVALPIDDLLKKYRRYASTDIVVRWISGTDYVDDQLMVGLIADNVSKLWDFRQDILEVVATVPYANIMPVTDWLEDYLTSSTKDSKDRQAA